MTFNKLERIVWMVAMGLLLVYRLQFLQGPLDEPSWRQAWCAYHAREASRQWPPDSLANYVNFRGAQSISYWTLPVYETLVALAYRVLGGENLLIARIITLVCYGLATWFLFRVVAELLDRRVALYSALAFFAMPLGIFYSRAVHYEALLLALVHGYLLASLYFVRRPNLIAALASCVLGILDVVRAGDRSLGVVAETREVAAGWRGDRMVGCLAGSGCCGASLLPAEL